MWVLFLFVMSFSVSAEIGTVSDTTSNECKIERNKQKLDGIKGSPIESLDIYITNNCVGNITFKDATKVKISEQSRLLIDDFVFDPKQSDSGKLALKVGLGTVRYASGQIAKNNPQQVGIQTPTATIAVRGTDFSMSVDETGQSLVLLLPSCNPGERTKQYELEENTCKVGKIDVETLAGKVSLDQAFQATFVQSAILLPTPPVVVNITESKISNNLLVSKPAEVQRAIADSNKSSDDNKQSMESEVVRRLSTQPSTTIKEITSQKESTIVPVSEAVVPEKPCDINTAICVIWDNPTGANKGNATLIKKSESEHYSEIKTQGTNTAVSIIQNDVGSSTIIGDTSNIINIKQNNGVKVK
jgi:hypothetical protein